MQAFKYSINDIKSFIQTMELSPRNKLISRIYTLGLLNNLYYLVLQEENILHVNQSKTVGRVLKPGR